MARGAALVQHYVIYGLVDPREPNRIRYVGKSHSPIARLLQHISGRSGAEMVGEWVADLRRRRLVPDMVLLEAVPVGGWGRERYWYDLLRAIGQADRNSAPPKRCRDFSNDRRRVTPADVARIEREDDLRVTTGYWAEVGRYASAHGTAGMSAALTEELIARSLSPVSRPTKSKKGARNNG